jgi:glycosyltransferase involved in cell wall biosynthesis
VSEKSNKKLIFVGHLSKTHGVQSVVSILGNIQTIIPDYEFVIIGSGPYQDTIKTLINEKGISSNVSLLGKLSNYEVLNILSSGGVGLAPYTLDDNWVYYCDPVKVKEYLACGCPVLISDLPEIAMEIEGANAGFVYRNPDELLIDLQAIATDYPKYIQMRENAIKLGRKFDWNDLFDKAFENIL